jgi:glycosyltransferase involved in cell wall biosynthesis
LSWTEKFGGEYRNIVKAHLRNFAGAKEKFGNIDIMNAHVSYPAGFSAMKINEQHNVPYIITEHMGPFPFDKFITDGKLSYKISEPLMKADEIIAVSNFLSGQITSFGIKKLAVIPNMFNEKLFYQVSKDKNRDAISFLTVSALIESKGIKNLMDGILLSVKMSPNNKFIIAGTGPLENYLDEFILNNSLSQKVTLIKNPSRAAVIKLFRECDAFILPSSIESFGIVYVEAMACGNPVIATDCGGPADFVNSETGILIPPDNVEEIANAIITMGNNINKYDTEKIRKYYMDNFSFKVVCSKIVSLYEEIIKSNA